MFVLCNNLLLNKYTTDKNYMKEKINNLARKLSGKE